MNEAFVSLNPLSLRPRWLVVDDNPHLARLVAMVLRRMNAAEVEEYQSAWEAMQAFQAKAQEYELIVTDLDMPEMSGLELATQARALNPEIKILLITGRKEQVDGEKLRRAGIRRLLGKPFDLGELAAMVNAMRQDPATADSVKNLQAA
ncbi:MAG: response regulator [Chthoniobacteraceae bacterium]